MIQTRGLTIPVRGMGGHWIVKLPDQRYDRVPENEFSMMTFAKAVGIDVPRVGLVSRNDMGVFQSTFASKATHTTSNASIVRPTAVAFTPKISPKQTSSIRRKSTGASTSISC